jgi:hypothetical protein
MASWLMKKWKNPMDPHHLLMFTTVDGRNPAPIDR